MPKYYTITPTNRCTETPLAPNSPKLFAGQIKLTQKDFAFPLKHVIKENYSTPICSAPFETIQTAQSSGRGSAVFYFRTANKRAAGLDYKTKQAVFFKGSHKEPVYRSSFKWLKEQ